MDARLIPFRRLKDICDCCPPQDRSKCSHADNKTCYAFDWGKCSQKTCPVWARLKQATANAPAQQRQSAEADC